MKTMQTALLISSLCCALGAYSQNTSAFGIGTKWIYERVSTTYPFLRSPVTYEITGQTLWNDTLAYVIEPGVFGFMDYMYIHGDSIYFWDRASNRFQLNYDFSATPGKSYESEWVGICDGSVSGTARTTVESLTELDNNGNAYEIQSVWVENNGSFTEDVNYQIYRWIGNDIGLTLYLGDGLCDFFRMSRLRCFEDGDNSYNFVGYPCDSTFIITSTIELDAANKVSIYPNPGDGQFFIKNTEGKSIAYKLYDAAGRTVQAGKLEDDQITIQRSGIYFLLLDVDGVLSSHKIVVLH